MLFLRFIDDVGVHRIETAVMSKARTIVALLGILGIGFAVVFFGGSGNRSSFDTTENTTSSTCELVDNKQLKPIDEVRFIASYSDLFSRLNGIGLTDKLQTACDMLLSQGFRLHDINNALVPIGAIGNPSDERVGLYTRRVILEGVSADPLSGIPSETTVTLFASSPATYSGVEVLISRITYQQPLTIEAWQEQLFEYFGAPSHIRYDVLPFWIIAQDKVQSGNPTDLCDPALANYRASLWEMVPEIDENADIPLHDGRNCSILIMADFIPSDEEQAPIGGTLLTMIDFASISENRRAENALVMSLRRPAD